MPDEPITVTQALARVMAELPGIGKDAQSPEGYRYRGIEAITAHLQGLLARHGVVIVPTGVTHEVVPSPAMKEGWQDYYQTTDWMIYGPDGTSIPAQTAGIGRDRADKGGNKAATQSYKVLLLELFCIGDKADDVDSQTYEQDRAAPAGRQATPQPPENAPERDEVIKVPRAKRLLVRLLTQRAVAALGRDVDPDEEAQIAEQAQSDARVLWRTSTLPNGASQTIPAGRVYDLLDAADAPFGDDEPSGEGVPVVEGMLDDPPTAPSPEPLPPPDPATGRRPVPEPWLPEAVDEDTRWPPAYVIDRWFCLLSAFLGLPWPPPEHALRFAAVHGYRPAWVVGGATEAELLDTLDSMPTYDPEAEVATSPLMDEVLRLAGQAKPPADRMADDLGV